MLILTRYLAREIVGPFLFGVMTFTAILVGFGLIAMAQNPLLGGETVLRLTVLSVPEHLALAFPMGTLLGTLFALGRLSGHSEVVAMRAGGLPAVRLMLPFLVFGVMASLASLCLSEEVAPLSHQAYSREMAKATGAATVEVIRRQVLPPEYDAGGRLKRLIHVGEFDLKYLYLRDVIINEYEQGRLRTVVHADEMAWDGGAWQFKRGYVVFFDRDGMMTRLTVNGGRAAYQPLLPKPKQIAIGANNPKNMTWPEFREFIAIKARKGEDVRRLSVELHTRLAIPFACLALAMIGTPLGLQTRRTGTAMSFGLAIAGLLSYFFLLSLAQVMARTGVIPPLIAAWFANIVLCGAGVALFIRRMR